MFRLAPIVLLASLCSLTTAQADKAINKNAVKPGTVANGTVTNAPPNSNAQQGPVAEGTVTNAPSGNEYIDETQPADGSPSAQPADADAIAAQQKPAEEPPPKGSADLDLAVLESSLKAFVHGANEGFWGVFGLSLTPYMLHGVDGVPTLLSDAIVVGFGYTKTQDLQLTVPLAMPAKAIALYGQAVIIDAQGFWTSDVVRVVVGGADAKQPAAIN